MRAGTDVLMVALLERIADGIDGLREDLAALQETAGASQSVERAPTPDQLLTAPQLAELLQVHPRTLRSLRNAGEIPAPILVGRSPRWDPATVRAWLESRMSP